MWSRPGVAMKAPLREHAIHRACRNIGTVRASAVAAAGMGGAGHGRLYRQCRRFQLDERDCDARSDTVRHRLALYAVGGAAIHTDRRCRRGLRSFCRPFQGRARDAVRSARRPCGRDNQRVGLFRRRMRIVDRDCGYHDADFAPRNAQSPATRTRLQQARLPPAARSASFFRHPSSW
jgi:hypothetical protein